MRSILVMLAIVSLFSSAYAGAGLPFVRGDANEDGTVDIGDPISILGVLSPGAVLPECPDAYDVNDDGVIGVIDAVELLSFLFVNGTPPPAPFPDPGFDLTPDTFMCLPTCVDAAALGAIVTGGFPLTICFPNVPFTEPTTGISVDFCTQTTATTCLGLAGCDVVIDVSSFTFDPVTLTAAFTVSVDITTIGLSYTIIFPGSCTSSLDSTVDGTITLTGTPITPTETVIDTAIVDSMVTTLDLDLSTCGLLALSEPLVEGALSTAIEAQLDTLAVEIEMLLIGQVVCTP